MDQLNREEEIGKKKKEHLDTPPFSSSSSAVIYRESTDRETHRRLLPLFLSFPVSLPNVFPFVALPLPSRGHCRANVIAANTTFASSFHPPSLRLISYNHQSSIFLLHPDHQPANIDRLTGHLQAVLATIRQQSPSSRLTTLPSLRAI
jgi:hypothetical protein